MKSKTIPKNKVDSFLEKTITTREILFLLLLLLCVSPVVSPGPALALGILVAQLIGNPFIHLNHKITHILLQLSVVGLGFGMNIDSALQAGKTGFLFTIISIFATLIAGYLLGKILKINKKTSFLISAGTAFCGGSAIAAISPVINAEEKQVSSSLGTIFILNSMALFIFPIVGHLLNLSAPQFGIWCAIAIQDTSSVVGASAKFGNEALQIATTVKLTRALWIIPLAAASSWLFKSQHVKIKIPYFIGFFVLAILLNTYCPVAGELSTSILSISKKGMSVCLFLIGSGLSKAVLADVGFRPVLEGFILWILISLGGLLAVLLILS